MRSLLITVVIALAASAGQAFAPAPALSPAGNCGAPVRSKGPGRVPMSLCANVTSLGAGECVGEVGEGGRGADDLCSPASPNSAHVLHPSLLPHSRRPRQDHVGGQPGSIQPGHGACCGRWRERGNRFGERGNARSASASARLRFRPSLHPPPPDDQIELYYASDLPANRTANVPLKTFPATLASTHLAAGRGSIVMEAPPYFFPVRAIFVMAHASRVSLRAQTGDITFDAPNAPQQVHSAPGKEASKAVVAWSTRDASAPRVVWGASPDALTSGPVEGDTFTYTTADLCGGFAATTGWSSPGALHRATLTGITPGSTVFYRVYDVADPLLTATGVYHAPPPPASPTRIVFKADEGQADADGAARGSNGWAYPASRNTSAAVTADVARAQDGRSLALSSSGARMPTPVASGFNATLIVHGGDVAYANGHAATWDAYMRDNEPAHGRAGIVTVIGNHERDFPKARPGDGARDRFGNSTDSEGECGVLHYARFTSPGATGPASPWWALDWGSVRLVGWSSEDDFAPGSPQHTCLKEALAATNRSATPFLVVVGHRPMYVDSAYPGSGNASDAAFSADARAALERLFYDAGVDLTAAGHHHSFQRTCAIGKDGACVRDASDERGVVHVVAGNAGADFTDGTMFDPTPPLFRRVAFEHGHLRLAADADTLTVTALDDANQSVIDEFTLKARGGGARGDNDARRSRSIAATSLVQGG